MMGSIPEVPLARRRENLALPKDPDDPVTRAALSDHEAIAVTIRCR